MSIDFYFDEGLKQFKNITDPVNLSNDFYYRFHPNGTYYTYLKEAIESLNSE